MILSKAVVLVFLVGVSCGLAQEVRIDSFHGNGELTWVCPSNSDSMVEWASSLSETAKWSSSWLPLRDITTPSGHGVAEVPMFYRVSSYTNGLFLRLPVGRVFTYAGTNALGGTWTSRVTCLGGASIAATTNNYKVLASKDIYSGSPPAGTDPDSLMLWRSTDTKVYMLDESAHEQLYWQNAAIGTTWTNAMGTNVVFAIETVTVPAGSFTNCVKIRHDDNSCEWISPGFFMVKSEFLHGDAAGPGTWVLQSWTDQ